MIRHGAKLVHAFAASRAEGDAVLRKAFGGAFIAMNSRDLGADYVFFVAAGDARGDGRQAGGRDRQAGATSPPPTTRRPRATRTPTSTATSTTSASPPRRSHRRDRPAARHARLTEALRTLEAVAHPAHGVRNIPP